MGIEQKHIVGQVTFADALQRLLQNMIPHSVWQSAGRHPYLRVGEGLQRPFNFRKIGLVVSVLALEGVSCYDRDLAGSRLFCPLTLL
jgi:hypothetical protein